MLRFEILTLFPGMFQSFLGESLIQKAIEKKHLDVELVDFRQHGIGKHKQVDDAPYGGGPGMVLRVEPVAKTLKERKKHQQSIGLESHTILLSPQGRPFYQAKAKELSELDKTLTLVCGRYEGFDERIRQLVDEEISAGDFICLGGEVIAMMMIEAISRLSPNVIGNQQSSEQESFSESLLEYPQFTRPVEFEGMEVPTILLSGNHNKIEEWRNQQSQKRTLERRPDLLKD